MKKETWEKIEEEFDVEVEGNLVIHLFETEQYKKIKDFICRKLEEREKEILEELLEETSHLSHCVTRNLIEKKLKELT